LIAAARDLTNVADRYKSQLRTFAGETDMALSNVVLRSFLAAAAAITLVAGSASAVEVINTRSGQNGGVPGVAGQLDDTVRFLNGANPPGGPVSLFAFTPADFAGAASGPAATVINAHPAWSPGISDTQARWINWQADLILNPDGTVGGNGYGSPGSALYAVPFTVTTPGATFATLQLEMCIDDAHGDWFSGGANLDGLYINGITTGYQGGNFGTPTTTSMVIPVNTGLNYMYFYQRDVGVLVSGLIFSATITVPSPGVLGLVAAGGLVALRRRR